MITKDHWEKHEEAAVHYVNLKASIELLKEINNGVKDDPAMNKKILEATESFIKIFTNITKRQPFLAPGSSFTPILTLTHIPANVEGENEVHIATKDPPSYIEGETDAMENANKQE
ncbi:hypothetical protein Tco_0154173 [Tanacetum coccineum]